MTNHLQNVHGLSKKAAEIKSTEIDIQAMKDEILGEGSKRALYLLLWDIETTGLITDQTPFSCIVEIAVCLFGRLEFFLSLVYPECNIPESAKASTIYQMRWSNQHLYLNV